MSSSQNTTKSFAIILLAAGASNRLGKPKQLLPFEGKSLLQHNIKTALDSIANQVMVVLGAHAETILKEMEMKQPHFHIAINTDWQEGMASSIRCGLNTLLELEPTSEGTIFMLCDQPYVTTYLLNNLIEAHKETGNPITSCSYGNTFGPPAFFHKSIYSELLQLKGDTGARKLIQRHFNRATMVPFPQGNIDIDTESDYENLMKSPA